MLSRLCIATTIVMLVFGVVAAVVGQGAYAFGFWTLGAIGCALSPKEVD